MSEAPPPGARADYGIDAPGVVLRFVLIAAGALLLGTVLRVALADQHHLLARSLFRAGVITALWCTGSAAVMVWGSKVGKLRLRDRVLDGLALRGDERLLDVGCGRGLLLIGAAKRLPSGRAVGLDKWQKEDQSGNAPEVTLANARAEGVAERIELQTGDMRQLPFEPGSFDVVVSSWALHNLYDAEGREQAIAEIVRVLKPGGRVALIDIQHATAYSGQLRALGLEDVQLSRPNYLFVIPTHTVTARKPAA